MASNLTLEAPPNQTRELAQQLRDLPVTVFHLGTTGCYRVRGVYRSVLEKINLLILSPEQAEQLAHELPAHLLVPPLWRTRRPRKNKAAWASGYLAAKKACLPDGQLFHSAFEIQTLPCPYLEAADRNAFDQGVEDYLSEIRRLAQEHRQAAQHITEHEEAI